MDSSEPASALSLPRDDTPTKRRIAAAIVGGARSIGFVAHHVGVTYEIVRLTLKTMIDEGWFKVVNTGDDEPVLRITVAQPGEQLLDVDLYAAILTAVRHGARTPTAIAARTGLPAGWPLTLAVRLTARTASRHTKEPP